MPVQVFRDKRETARDAVLAHAGFDQDSDFRIARFSENVDHCIVYPGASFHSSCLILSGGMIRTDMPKPRIGPGAVTVEPVDFGGTFTNDVQTDWITVYISAERICEMACELSIDPADVQILRAEGVADPYLSDLIQCSARALLHPMQVTRLELDGWAQIIGSCLLHRHSSICVKTRNAPDALNQTALRIVLEAIEADLESDLSLIALARVLDISTTRLSAGFRDAMGMSLHQYVLSRRIERARDLLKTTDLSLADVAFSVGFSSQSHMTRAFRERLGVTPGRYRRLS